MALGSTIIFDILFVSLCMTFGGSPYPSQWSYISEIACDMNDLIQCNNWDPATHHSPHQFRIPAKAELPAHIPFSPACTLAVDYPINDKSLADVYINDITTITPNIGKNANQCSAAALLILHTLSQPLTPNEPLSWADMISLTKLDTEGQPSI